MSFEDIGKLFNLHNGIAQRECELGRDEDIILRHLTRAAELARKSTGIKEHRSTLPLLDGRPIPAAPDKNGDMWMKLMKERLAEACYDAFRGRAWFVALMDECGV